MEEWRVIPEFPEYSVSTWGRVKNNKTGRILVLTRNQYGVVQVGFFLDGVQYKRGVAKLVAHSFLDPSALTAFDTPINLDGDRTNNHMDNLMWRPRWFAVKYHRQFHGYRSGIKTPIVEIKTGEEFKNSFEAAKRFGLLDREIFIATLNNTYVWPTYQVFRAVQE